MSYEILSHVYRHPGLSETDLALVVEAHERVTFPKNSFLLKAGQTADGYCIVESGLIRSFLYDFEGNEITTDFVSAGEVCIEVASIFQRVPTVEYMQALCEVTAWKIDFELFQKLFISIPGLAEWGRAWMSSQLVFSKRRATEMITDSAAQRYEKLMRERPQILQQAPLKYIASYLGVTDSSLSRIRKG